MGKRTPSTSVSISFGVSGTVETPAIGISLDSDKNTQVYNQEGKTSFLPNEAAYLKVISNVEKYTVHTSLGNIQRTQTGILYDITEDLTFAMESRQTLTHLPSGAIQYVWLGKHGGIPLFREKAVSVSEPVVGVLRCIYQTHGDRFKLVVTTSQITGYTSAGGMVPALVVATIEDGAKSHTTVNYGGAAASKIPVNLRVSDFCNNAILEGVSVYVNGSLKGTTNVNGVLYLGEMSPGSIHNLLMVKDGYVDSNLDVLYNDQFTVPDIPE